MVPYGGFSRRSWVSSSFVVKGQLTIKFSTLSKSLARPPPANLACWKGLLSRITTISLRRLSSYLDDEAVITPSYYLAATFSGGDFGGFGAYFVTR